MNATAFEIFMFYYGLKILAQTSDVVRGNVGVFKLLIKMGRIAGMCDLGKVCLKLYLNWNSLWTFQWVNQRLGRGKSGLAS